LSLALMRSRRDFRLIRKEPRRLRPQMKVNPSITVAFEWSLWIIYL